MEDRTCQNGQVQPRSSWRMDLLFAILLLAIPAMGVRLTLLMQDCRDMAVARAERQHRLVVPTPARPGNIYGRSGNSYVLLAGSKQMPSCYADPSMIDDGEIENLSDVLSAIFGIPSNTIRDSIVAKKQNQNHRSSRFLWLKRELTAREVEQVRNLKHSAIGIVQEWRRDYPIGNIGAQLVGYATRDGRGGEGIELSAEEVLAPINGIATFTADARRRPIWDLPDECKLPVDGKNVYLTMDVNIQQMLQDAVTSAAQKYSAKWAVGVLVDPRTGQVLGMCSNEFYDSNNYAFVSAEARLNRPIVCPYEPGSVVKPLFAAAAVDMGLATWESKIYCEKGIYHAPRGGRISDHGSSYGSISLADVIVFSSNIGMAKLGEMFGNEKLNDVARMFGFGSKTGIELKGESGGILRPLSRWDTYSTRRVPFGQEMSTTALQLAMAFSSLANGGLLLRPHLVDCVADPAGKEIYNVQPEVVRRVVKPEIAAESLKVMADVVTRGTAKASRDGKYSMFGKTGTAQIAGRGGYTPNAYVASFIGGAPVNNPQLICVISVYWPESSKGYYGGKVAAPYVREVLEKALSYMNVPPDQMPGQFASGSAGHGRESGGW